MMKNINRIDSDIYAYKDYKSDCQRVVKKKNKNKMSKIFVAFLTLLLIIPFSGCSEDEYSSVVETKMVEIKTPTPTSTPTPVPTPSPTPSPTVVPTPTSEPNSIPTPIPTPTLPPESKYHDGFLIANYVERSISGGTSRDVYLKGTIEDISNAQATIKDETGAEWTVTYSTSLELSNYIGTECEVYGSNIPGISNIYGTPLIELRKDDYHMVFCDGKDLYPTIQDSCNQFPSMELQKNTGSDSMTVWVTDSGKKYHSSPTCSRMKNPYQITEEQAISQGKTRCSKCW